MTGPTSQLDYAMTLRWHQRRKVRAAIVAFVMVALFAPAWFYFDTIGERIALIAAQRRCAAGVLSPGQVVFEEDPVRATPLLRFPGYVSDFYEPKGSVTITSPTALTNYPRGRLVASKGGSSVPLFVGRLSDDDGKPAIVYVHAGLGITPGAQAELPISYWCDPLATLSWRDAEQSSGGAVELGSMPVNDELRGAGVHRMLTLLAGTPDPNDARRVTIPYAVDGANGTIECIYRRVGVMDMKVLDGPLAPGALNTFAESMKNSGSASEPARRQ
jgi:hypothetical protein